MLGITIVYFSMWAKMNEQLFYVLNNKICCLLLVCFSLMH